MIYKYTPYRESGINGATIHARLGEKDTRLGEIDGDVFVNFGATPAGQDERINLTQVYLTQEQKERLISQRADKSFTRVKLEEVGDIQDFIADAMKLIEFNMMLTARLAGDLWGTNLIDDATKEVYKARNKAFLDAVGAGAITLRGDFDNMDSVMSRMLKRVSKTNQIVRDNYVSELQRIGLA